MLSLEHFGLLALAILWVSVLLIAADAWSVLRDLRALARTVRSVVRARVKQGEGEGGTLATLTFEQLGHALDGAAPAIDVSHGAFETTVAGGILDVDGTTCDVERGAPLRVFFDDAAFEREGASAPADFDSAFERAASPRGYSRPLALSVKEGDEVFFADGAVLATFDPRSWVAKKSRLVALYIALHLVTAGLVTGVALAMPMDTLVAKLGGALSLAHFLGSAPLLRAVKEAARAPDEARRFWTWKLDRAPGASPAAAGAR
jgi:hypothetical protein